MLLKLSKNAFVRQYGEFTYVLIRTISILMSERMAQSRRKFLTNISLDIRRFLLCR